MRKIFTTVFLAVCTLTVSAQEVVSVEDQGIIPSFILNIGLQGAVTVDKDVQSYKITYSTTDPFGVPTVASGLLALPVGPAQTPALVVYNHGTVASRDAVPSTTGVLERFIPQAFAGRGFIALAPDYLGLGDNPGIHPYLHAATEASAGRDMVIAVKAWLAEQSIAQNDQLFVTGYSQGGHASMALHRSIETDETDDLEITAAAHLSGVYFIAPPSPGILGLSRVNPTQLSFFVNTAISYNHVNNLYGTTDQLFTEPYLTEVNRFLSSEIDLYEMGLNLDTLLRNNSALVGEMFVDQFVLDVLAADPTLFNAYTENSVAPGFAPTAPTLLYYCDADQTVPPTQSITADSVLRSNGADSVLLVNGGSLDHGACAVPAAATALAFFEARYRETVSSLGTVVDRSGIAVFPNPVTAGARLRITGLDDAARAYELYDFTGRAVARGLTAPDGTVRTPVSLQAGNYALRIGLADGTSVVRRLSVR